LLSKLQTTFLKVYFKTLHFLEEEKKEERRDEKERSGEVAWREVASCEHMTPLKKRTKKNLSPHDTHKE